MRRSTILSNATALLSSCMLLSSGAFAADAGTYRPGKTYNSITANSPDICDMQCSGDAQCRSWNFVRVSEMAEGVCEFNDNMSSPVPSAISISGNNVSRPRAARVIAGKTNTVRIGAPSVTQSASRAAKPRPSVAPRNTQRPPSAGRSLMQQQRLNSQRNVNTQRNMSTPQQYRPPVQNAAAPRVPQKPQFRHSLEEGRAPRMAHARAPHNAPAPKAFGQAGAAKQGSAAPQSYAHADPRLQKKLQQRQQSAQAGNTAAAPAPQYAPYAPKAAPQTYAASSGGLSAPPGVPPLAAQTPAASSYYMALAMAGAPTQRRVTIPSELSPRPMGTGDTLFGSLYDDVKVPRPIDPALAADPEAPIPTVSSVPVR